MQLEQYHATLLRAGVTFDPGLSAEEVQEVERRWQFRIYTTFRTPHYNVRADLKFIPFWSSLVELSGG
jgi:hypothetical protein